MMMPMMAISAALQFMHRDVVRGIGMRPYGAGGVWRRVIVSVWRIFVRQCGKGDKRQSGAQPEDN